MPRSTELVRAVGCGKVEGRRVWTGSMPYVAGRTGLGSETKLDRPERPCSNCGKTFQPTVRRRLLCAWCFDHSSRGMD